MWTRIEKPLSIPQVPPEVRGVLNALYSAGYEAYLVGGCVRDHLLNRPVKDYDVATSALPDEVMALFPRTVETGKSFGVVRVLTGEGESGVEVATFRKESGYQDHRHPSRVEFSGVQEDASRRDFTVNALYYDPVDEELRDFVGGIADLAAGRLRFIGDTATRLREDPVRILRAVRFHAKLGFALDPSIERALPDCARRLGEIPPARLFDEVCKLFESGVARRIWGYLAPTPLRRALFPTVPPNDPLIDAAMASTDARVQEDKPVTPGFLLAVLFWRDYAAHCAGSDSGRGGSRASADDRAHAASAALGAAHDVITIPRRFSQFVRDVWFLQPKLEAQRPKSARIALEHPRFRAGYDFLLLRAASGELLEEQADWWTHLQTLSGEARTAAIDALTDEAAPEAKKKRRRRRRKPRGAGVPSDGLA